MPEVTLGPGTHTLKAQRVYLREKWADAWTLQPYLHCLEATWSVAPSMPTASFFWRYGASIRHPGQTFTSPSNPTQAFDSQSSMAVRRYFVKVEFDDDIGTTRKWVGVIEINEDQVGGIDVATGEQTLTAYGMESLLNSHVIRQTHWHDGLAEHVVDVAHVFNRRGRNTKAGIYNRTKIKYGLSYLFAHDLDNADKWSSKNIVEYLLATQTPKDELGGTKIPFELPDSSLTPIPDWDDPEVEQDRQTTYSLLERILNRQRLLVWRLDYEESTNAMKVITDTLNSSAFAMSLPGSPIVPANAHQVDLRFDNDQLTTAVVKESDIEYVDQVVYRGARIISVGAFSYGGDFTLEPAWEAADETAYEAGASGVTGYADLSKAERQRRNSEVRNSTKLQNVFALYRIPKTWNRKVRDGEGGTANPLFPVLDSGGSISPDPYPVYLPQCYVEQTLPLLVGVDYSGDAIKNGTFTEPTTNKQELPPLVFFSDSSGTRWTLAEVIGDVAGWLERTSSTEIPDFSCSVQVPEETQAVRINVTGAPQHAIATSAFTPIAGDDPVGSGYDSYSMIVVLALPDDRYVEGVYPPVVSNGTDVVRQKIIYADEKHRKIYVAPGTPLGTNSSGALLRSTGGWIPKPGNADDETKLTALALTASQWYCVTRYVLSLETRRMPDTGKLELGYLVTAIGEPSGPNRQTINSIVTQIKIRSPMGSGRGGEEISPVCSMMTWAGELDPMQARPIKPRPSMVKPPKDDVARVLPTGSVPDISGPHFTSGPAPAVRTGFENGR